MEKKQGKIKLDDLHPQEIELIYLIRTKYRYGTIEIQVRQGLPVDVLRTVERVRLSDVVDK
jgi:hypothetical protein